MTYKVKNRIFKAVLFFVLAILPLVLGLRKGLELNFGTAYYFILLGTCASIVYNLPKKD